MAFLRTLGLLDKLIMIKSTTTCSHREMDTVSIATEEEIQKVNNFKKKITQPANSPYKL